MPTVNMVNIMPKPSSTADVDAMATSFDRVRDDFDVVIYTFNYLIDHRES